MDAPAPHERPQRPALPHAVHHGDGGAADDDRKLVEIFGEIEWLIPGAFSRLFASLFSGVKRLSALPAIAPHAGSTTSYRRRRRHTSLVTHIQRGGRSANVCRFTNHPFATKRTACPTPPHVRTPGAYCKGKTSTFRFPRCIVVLTPPQRIPRAATLPLRAVPRPSPPWAASRQSAASSPSRYRQANFTPPLPPATTAVCKNKIHIC